MPQSTADNLVRRHFHERSLRVRVILTQTPLSLTVMLLIVHAAVIYPQVFSNPAFITGLWLHAGILALCLLVPWDRLPHPTFLVIPYLDFVAIGFTRHGSLEHATSAGLLILFPVFWLSASGLARKTAIVGSTLGTLLMVWGPLFLDSAPLNAELLGKPLLFPFMMAGFAVTVVALTSSMDSQRLDVVAKDAQLRSALEASRQREQLLATILDTVPVGLVVIDGQGHDSLMNATQKAIHVLATPADVPDPAEDQLLVFGRDKVTPLPAEERPVRRAVMGETFSNSNIWIGSGDKARAFSTTARPIKDEDGQFNGAVVAFSDITEMTAASAARDEFVANVSHEFRTPLTSILGYAGLVLEDAASLPAGVPKSLSIIERNAERLLGLVNDLLDTKAVEVHPAPADFSKLVDHCVAAAAPAATRNGVTLRGQVQGPLPVMVDAGRIGQVLDNLVSNAIKYSPDGGTVTVRAWADGDDLLCEVQDTGMGLSNTEQARAFTRFFRAEHAVKRSIPGLGLGLLITKTIVEKHGGTVTLQSALGAGTTVGFVLPQAASGGMREVSGGTGISKSGGSPRRERS